MSEVFYDLNDMKSDIKGNHISDLTIHIDHFKENDVFNVNYYIYNCNHSLKTPLAILIDDIFYEKFQIEKFDYPSF